MKSSVFSFSKSETNIFCDVLMLGVKHTSRTTRKILIHIYRYNGFTKFPVKQKNKNTHKNTHVTDTNIFSFLYLKKRVFQFSVQSIWKNVFNPSWESTKIRWLFTLILMVFSSLFLFSTKHCCRFCWRLPWSVNHVNICQNVDVERAQAADGKWAI